MMAPATLMPDMQAKNPRTAMFQGVSDKHVITDGRQTIEVHATGGDTHTNEYTLVYLPGPRILVEGDAYSPGPPDAPPPATPPPNAVRLYDDIQKLKLNVATIAPIDHRGDQCERITAADVLDRSTGGAGSHDARAPARGLCRSCQASLSATSAGSITSSFERTQT